MFGYILAGVIGLVLLGFLIAGLSHLRPGRGTRGKVTGDKPVQADQPAADEPTPDRSVTAKPQQIRTARGHTPPA
jgi:hypothetical protein